MDLQAPLTYSEQSSTEKSVLASSAAPPNPRGDDGDGGLLAEPCLPPAQDLSDSQGDAAAPVLASPQAGTAAAPAGSVGVATLNAQQQEPVVAPAGECAEWSTRDDADENTQDLQVAGCVEQHTPVLLGMPPPSQQGS